VIPRLAGRLHGELLLPHDQGYDDARRGFNRLHGRRPAVTVRPADADDIARALEAAAGAGLEVAIRSGGHSLAGYGTTEGGLLLDLSSMPTVRIDAGARVASVEAGATTGQLTAATAAHGLVVPFGDSPTVGVAASPWAAGSAG
jgi:FAD/FMN-containing dehydrogenase